MMRKHFLNKVFIIAEAGVNHNGDVEIAKKMIDEAASAGVDAVKFQMFKPQNMTSRYAPKAEYQIKTTDPAESQLNMLKRLNLDLDSHKELFDYCKKKNLMFLASAFDLESIDELNSLGIEIFKIPSGEITNLPYLRKIGSLKKKIILSTGMADLNEIRNTLKVLEGAGTAKGDITVLHCSTEYPVPFNEINLRAMLTIKKECNIAIGYSDHSLGIEVAIAAAALGAEIIEKHFTLDRSMEGPDHKASLEPDELKSMIKAIRNIEAALGDDIKKPSPSELKNRPIVRKGIVAASNIKKGEVFTEKNIAVKRPASGINPMQWNKIMGKVAKRGFEKDEAISL